MSTSFCWWISKVETIWILLYWHMLPGMYIICICSKYVFTYNLWQVDLDPLDGFDCMRPRGPLCIRISSVSSSTSRLRQPAFLCTITRTKKFAKKLIFFSFKPSQFNLSILKLFVIFGCKENQSLRALNHFSVNSPIIYFCAVKSVKGTWFDCWHYWECDASTNNTRKKSVKSSDDVTYLLQICNSGPKGHKATWYTVSQNVRHLWDSGA